MPPKPPPPSPKAKTSPAPPLANKGTKPPNVPPPHKPPPPASPNLKPSSVLRPPSSPSAKSSARSQSFHLLSRAVPSPSRSPSSLMLNPGDQPQQAHAGSEWSHLREKLLGQHHGSPQGGHSSPSKATKAVSSWYQVKEKLEQMAQAEKAAGGASGAAGATLRSEQRMDDTLDPMAEEKESEARRILELIAESVFFEEFPEKTKKAILAEKAKRTGKIHPLDIITMKERGSKDGQNLVYEEEHEEEDQEHEGDQYYTDRKHRERWENEHRLQYLWLKRSKCTNYSLWILFRGVIITNMMLSMIGSYRITIEHAKFDHLYLSDTFNCLERTIPGDYVEHFFNILHAFTAIAVLFTGKLETANLCWAYVFVQLSHACYLVFVYAYEIRIPAGAEDETSEVELAVDTVLFFLKILYMVFSLLVVVQRYYDITNVENKRTQRFTSTVYAGLSLNEHIIFKNEARFLQKKYTFRQVVALEVYLIVLLVQHERKLGITHGEGFETEIKHEIKNALEDLKRMKQIGAASILKELRQRIVDRIRMLEEVTTREEIGVVATERIRSKKAGIKEVIKKTKGGGTTAGTTGGDQIPGPEKEDEDEYLDI